MGITVRVPGHDAIQVERVDLDKSDHLLPYLTCSVHGDGTGTDGQVLRELADPMEVIVVFEDDGRAFPANVQLIDGIIECMPISSSTESNYVHRGW